MATEKTGNPLCEAGLIFLLPNFVFQSVSKHTDNKTVLLPIRSSLILCTSAHPYTPLQTHAAVDKALMTPIISGT